MNDQPRHSDAADAPGQVPDALRAFFRNQEHWLERLSIGQSQPARPHPRIRHDASVTTVRTGQSGVMCLNLHDPSSTADLAAFDRSWRWLRSYGQRDVLVWSLTDRPAMNLALLARGFETSFQPAWMARSLAGPIPDVSVDNVTVRVATADDIDEMGANRAIPYLVPDQVETTRRLALESGHRAVWWLVARDRSRVLGQAIVNMTGDIAGLYNVAVDPEVRRRGIGRALTASAMRLAHEQGATSMGLNATPDGLDLYRDLGFRHLGDGQTWLLPEQRFREVPDERIVAIAEAIGAGRIGDLHPDAIPALLPNGDLPIQFAARFGQADTVHWLLQHGATPDALSLWDAGLHEEAALALTDPSVVNRPSGPHRATPLHIAVERGDTSLAELLITAGADLTTRDAQFRSTPLGWAEHLHRPEIAAMIRRAGGR